VAAAARGAAAAGATGRLATDQLGGSVAAPRSARQQLEFQSARGPPIAVVGVRQRAVPRHAVASVTEHRRARRAAGRAPRAPFQRWRRIAGGRRPGLRLGGSGSSGTIPPLCRLLRAGRCRVGSGPGDVTAAATAAATPDAGAGPRAGDVAATTCQRPSSQHRPAIRGRGAAIRRPVGSRSAGAPAKHPVRGRRAAPAPRRLRRTPQRFGCVVAVQS